MSKVLLPWKYGKPVTRHFNCNYFTFVKNIPYFSIILKCFKWHTLNRTIHGIIICHEELEKESHVSKLIYWITRTCLSLDSNDLCFDFLRLNVTWTASSTSSVFCWSTEHDTWRPMSTNCTGPIGVNVRWPVLHQKGAAWCRELWFHAPPLSQEWKKLSKLHRFFLRSSSKELLFCFQKEKRRTRTHTRLYAKSFNSTFQNRKKSPIWFCRSVFFLLLCAINV